jgi:hypothetical protein
MTVTGSPPEETPEAGVTPRTWRPGVGLVVGVGVGVRVGVGVCVGVGVFVGVGDVSVTTRQAENSDVVEDGTVAAEVTAEPRGIAGARTTEKLAWPPPSVETVVNPTTCSASPWPDESHVALEKNSIRTFDRFDAPSRVPWIVVLPPIETAESSTGKLLALPG